MKGIHPPCSLFIPGSPCPLCQQLISRWVTLVNTLLQCRQLGTFFAIDLLLHPQAEKVSQPYSWKAFILLAAYLSLDRLCPLCQQLISRWEPQSEIGTPWLRAINFPPLRKTVVVNFFSSLFIARRSPIIFLWYEFTLVFSHIQRNQLYYRVFQKEWQK